MTTRRRGHPAVPLAVAALSVLLAACATVRGVLALRHVSFDLDRAADVRLAGVRLDDVRSFTSLDIRDGARLATAVARGQVPLAFNLWVRGENPADNRVTARLVRMSWTLFLNGRETISGTVDTAHTFAPGSPTTFAVPIELELLRFFRYNARDAFELARGLTGAGGAATQIQLRAVPVLDTPLGPIRYPEPITIVRRTVGGP